VRHADRALQDLRISEERQSLVLSALPMAVYVKDSPDARPRFVAGNVALLTGYQAAEFETDPEFWASRVHPEDRVELTVGNGQPERSIEYRWKHADGEYRHFLDQSVRPSSDDFIAGTLRDVTEQRTMQDQLLQAQKMEALGKLTGGIAHDFNNLLASVLSGLALIERRAKLDGSASDLLGMTRHAAEQGRELVTRLLSFSRRQKLVPQVVDLALIQSSLGSMLKPMLGGLVDLRWELAPDLWPTYADAPQLELVLMNLAINARDAMPEGGSISVSVSNQTTAGGDDLAPGDYVRITMSDTGHGIPADLLSKVVEPFFTTKDVGKGTGLGLSMAYGFAQQSGGALRIESRVGEGTCVSLWLPRSNVDPLPTLAPTKPAEKSAPRSPYRRILLVDDSPSLRALTEMQLQQEGYEVTAASGGGDALAFIERDPAAFDVIVTDFAMPLMSGLELIRRARTLQPDYPAVIITGYANGPELSGRTENVEVVLKPFSSNALDRAVQTVLRRRGSRDAIMQSPA
jgi:signal transduction histidine kinase